MAEDVHMWECTSIQQQSFCWSHVYVTMKQTEKYIHLMHTNTVHLVAVLAITYYTNWYKKLSYRRETARQLHTSFSAHSLIVHFTEHRICFTAI